jgi:hypothetical protein
MVRHNFPTADPVKYRTGFDRSMAELESRSPDDLHGRADAFSEALVCVLAWSLLTAVGDATSKDRSAGFYRHAGESLIGHPRELGAVKGDLYTAIWEHTPEGWYGACLIRSSAEAVAQHVDGDLDRPMFDRGWLTEINDEMRRTGADLPPLPVDVIPRGIPENHWWWTLPAGPALADDYSDVSY